jgi:hypothetical protein
MKLRFHRWIGVTLLAASLASSVGCYPYTSDYYGPGAPNGGVAHNQNQDAKGYSVAPAPVAPAQPRYAGVDPGVVVAGVAAAGLLGYAIGNNHGYHHGYYGPGYYRPVPYGYYGPRYCR